MFPNHHLGSRRSLDRFAKHHAAKLENIKNQSSLSTPPPDYASVPRPGEELVYAKDERDRHMDTARRAKKQSEAARNKASEVVIPPGEEVPSSPERLAASEEEGDFSGPQESEESDTESVWSSEGEHERWKQMSYGERFAHCQGWVSCIRCPPTELIHEQVINWLIGVLTTCTMCGYMSSL